MEMIAEYTELEKNGYILDAHLTQFVLPEYAHEIEDNNLVYCRLNNLVFKIEDRCRENGYIKNHSMLRLGYMDIEGERCRTFGIYTKDKQ